MFRNAFLTTALSLTLAAPALAHDGRRFEVIVNDNQLAAQGYISDGVDDGGGVVRPYLNTIHGHFLNLTTSVANADLPSYDVFDNADQLIGHDLTWTATGFMKWSAPAHHGPVTLSPLDPDEVIEVFYAGVAVRSDTYTTGNDTLTLLANFNGSNGDELDMSYRFYGDNPSGEIYVIQSILTTTAPGVEASSTVYTLLSPDGPTMAERLHHQSLHLEDTLGLQVPEPATLGLAALLPVMMRRRRA